MSSIEWAFNRLIEGAAISSVVFAAGSLAVVCCRQPVRRLRIILLTLVAAFLAPLVNLVPGLPHWSLPRIVQPAGEIASTSQESAVVASIMDDTAPPETSATSQSSLPDPDADDSEPTGATAASELAEIETDDALAISSQFEQPDEPEPAPAARASQAPTALNDSTAAHRAAHRATHAIAAAAEPRAGFRTWTVAAYVAGVSALFAWWGFGLACLWRLVGNARPAPARCRALLREIAGYAADDVRLLVSSRAAQPCTFAWRYPVIVLPRALATDDFESNPHDRDAGRVDDSSNSQLRLCLAHEFAHVARGDVWLWSFAGLLRLVYFYQPLCWWLRGQLRLCQDYLADAAAARWASPETYAEFLATRAAGSPLAPGLGIAGSKSELYRRVAMLVQNPFTLETRCSTAWTIAAGCAATVLTVVTATFGGKPETLAAERPAAQRAPITAIEDARQSPLDDTDTALLPPDKAAKSGPQQGEPGNAAAESAPGPSDRKRILERLATRNTRFAGGTIRFERRHGPAGDDEFTSSEHLALTTNGTTWLLRSDPVPIDGRTGIPGGMPGRMSRTTPGAVPGGMPAGMSATGKSSRMPGGPPGMGSMRSSSGFGPPGSPGNPQPTFTLVEDGRSLNGFLVEDLPGMGRPRESLRLARGSALTIYYAESAERVSERQTPFGLGTIYYESGRRFIGKHAAAARFLGISKFEIPVLADVPRVGDLMRVAPRTQLIEWDVAGDEAEEAFPGHNAFLNQGGLLRVWVADDLDDLVTRIEGVDRFGTVQFSADFLWFFQGTPPKASSTFPMAARFESGESRMDFLISELIPADKKAQSVSLPLSIPVGVKVVDMRPKKQDELPSKRSPGAQFGPNLAEYPFHSFTTTAMYLDGFPKKLLDEIDRDVLPWVEAAELNYNGETGIRGRKKNSKSAPSMMSSANSGTAASPGSAAGTTASSSKKGSSSTSSATDKSASSTAGNTTPADPIAGKSAKAQPIKAGLYAGKDFQQWRQTLMDDLDPATRKTALVAIGAFGANGYAEEAAQTIGAILLTGDQQANNNLSVFSVACTALSTMGPAAVPVLHAQLDGNIPAYRREVVQSLSTLSRWTREALPALQKAARDDDQDIRGRALAALAGNFLDVSGVSEAVAAELKDTNQQTCEQITQSLAGNRTGPAEAVLELLELAMHFDDHTSRPHAAREFATRAPTTPQNIAALTRSVTEGSSQSRSNFVNEVRRRSNQKVRPNPELLVPVLLSLLETEGLDAQSDVNVLVQAVELIGEYARAKSAEQAVPVLVTFLRGELPGGGNGWSVAMSVKAIDALGRMGPSAKAAIPALKELLNGLGPQTIERSIEIANWSNAGIESTRHYRSRIETAIRKIEADSSTKELPANRQGKSGF